MGYEPISFEKLELAIRIHGEVSHENYEVSDDSRTFFLYSDRVVRYGIGSPVFNGVFNTLRKAKLALKERNERR